VPPRSYAQFSAHNFAADGLREALGFDTHAEVMGRMPDFMTSFWSLCPSLACGFKVFPGQVRPISSLRQLFSGVPPEDRHTLRAIVLERTNVTAEWLSVTRASQTGNWGTSPQRQQTIASSTRLSERLRQAAMQDQQGRRAVTMPPVDGPATGEVTGGGEGGGGKAGGGKGGGKGGGGKGGGVSLAQFTREHKTWFAQVKRVVSPVEGGAKHDHPLPSVPVLHVSTEELIGGGVAFEAAMRKTYEFLQLPPLEGPLTLPARVTAPEKNAVGKRVSKSRAYKQRKEAEVNRRAALQQSAKGKGPGAQL
jgi:hypothetical protein